MNPNGLGRRIAIAVGATLVAGVFAFSAAPGAAADDPCLPENGCVPGEVEPPVPPDQAGNPQPVTIDWVPIPDVPPSVGVPLGLPAPPHQTCKHRRKHAAASKKCKKKRHRTR